MTKEIEIPEGYEARIEGNKVILELKDSEDERIRKGLVKMISGIDGGYPFEKYGIVKKDALAYLEKQKEAQPGDEDRYMVGYMNGMNDAMKEQKPAINIEHLKSYLLQYLQDASNRKEDSEIEADTNKWARMIIKVFGGVEQKPAEWGEEDKQWLEAIIKDYENSLTKDKDHAAVIKIEIDFLKSLPERFSPQPHWKPSNEQMVHLAAAVEESNENQVLDSLYNDLKKL